MPKLRIALVVIAAVAAVAVIPAQSGASGAGLQNCGGSVRAGLVPCPKAKRIATEYAKTRASSLQGFRCRSKRNGSQISARCVLNEKLVLFSFRT
ncbi:MAG: hypothetical protein QOD14_504 [Solirubrobacterales bacterium]|jgi:hypothetical protein|nr:hypothetical protein [Solirubrobacterales bacterium]